MTDVRPASGEPGTRTETAVKEVGEVKTTETKVSELKDGFWDTTEGKEIERFKVTEKPN